LTGQLPPGHHALEVGRGMRACCGCRSGPGDPGSILAVCDRRGSGRAGACARAGLRHAAPGARRASWRMTEPGLSPRRGARRRAMKPLETAAQPELSMLQRAAKRQRLVRGAWVSDTPSGRPRQRAPARRAMQTCAQPGGRCSAGLLVQGLRLGACAARPVCPAPVQALFFLVPAARACRANGLRGWELRRVGCAAAVAARADGPRRPAPAARAGPCARA